MSSHRYESFHVTFKTLNGTILWLRLYGYNAGTVENVVGCGNYLLSSRIKAK